MINKQRIELVSCPQNDVPHEFQQFQIKTVLKLHSTYVTCSTSLFGSESESESDSDYSNQSLFTIETTFNVEKDGLW